MSKLLDKESNTLGSIASIQTLLERYPTLTTTDSMLTNFSVNTSVGFLLDVLSVLGVSQTDLIKWISKLLTGGDGKGSDGLLNVIEQAIKAILLLNIKDMWTCSVNPILPDSLMKYSNPNFKDGTREDPCIAIPTSDEMYRKIEIDLNQVDMFGMLNNCPSDPNGGMFYFDAYDSMEDVEGESKPHLNPNNLWKSCDFNAYLWYIINKGTISNKSDLQYSCWDNRNNVYKYFEKDETLKDNFFNIETCMTEESAELDKIPITGDNGNNADKKQLIICEFEERNTPSTDEGSLPSSNILRVWLNANRYYKTRKITGKNPVTKEDFEMSFNRTIFEFNADYIYSLKLFDTKTLVAQIVNSLLGLTASVSASFSVQQKIIEAKVSEIIKKVIEADDQSSSDCYYTFSNDEYNSMLNDATLKYNGVYSTGGSYGTLAKVDSEAILESLRNLKCSGSLVEQTSNITKTLEEITATVASPASITEECKFNFGLNFIKDFIQQTVTQIVLQVLTPKVAILYIINGAIMGSEVDNVQAWSNVKSWEDFLKNFQNVLFTIIKQVKDIIVEQLYNYVMEQIKPLLELMISKIALETVQYYKDLIEQLLLNCIPSIPSGSSNGTTTIDNVNYADIISEANPTDVNNNKNC